MTDKPERACTVFLGVVGWMHDDWKGVVYPRIPPQGFEPLGHLARFIDCVELDDTLYHPLTPFMAARWAERTSHNPQFRFVVRMWQRFTHQREVQWSSSDAAIFKKGIQPLADAGKLGALLFQFPMNFRCDGRDRVWLQRLAKEFAAYPRLIEVRHFSWITEEGLRFLRENQFGFCTVSPSVFLRPSSSDEISTSGCGAFRLQGRGIGEEFRSDDSGDFMYGKSEIDSFAERIRAFAQLTDELFVTFSNHVSAQSVVNALQLKSVLLGRQVLAPKELCEAHSLLNELAVDLPDSIR